VEKEKLRSKKQICTEILVNSPVNPQKEKEGYGEKDLHKRKYLSQE